MFVIVGLAQWYDRRPLCPEAIEGSNPNQGIFLSLLFDNDDIYYFYRMLFIFLFFLFSLMSHFTHRDEPMGRWGKT